MIFCKITKSCFFAIYQLNGSGFPFIYLVFTIIHDCILVYEKIFLPIPYTHIGGI
jgi:hypothetical protein